MESFIWNKNSSHSTLCFLLFIGSLSLYNYYGAGDEVKELTNIQFPLRNFFKRKLSIKFITKVVVPVLAYLTSTLHSLSYAVRNLNLFYFNLHFILNHWHQPIPPYMSFYLVASCILDYLPFVICYLNISIIALKSTFYTDWTDHLIFPSSLPAHKLRAEREFVTL